ncbi:MAG: RNA polymerase sigma factor [Faecousia sp.]
MQKKLASGGHQTLQPPRNRAQAANPLLAPLTFSTPLCKVRYQKMAAFAERCCFFCRKAASFNTRKENSKYSSAFIQKASAFLEKIRGPPSEIWFSSIKFQSKEVCTMADKEKYMIKVEGKLVEVTPEVYYAYFRMERQERWQEEKKWEHGVVSYDALDNGTTVGAEAMPDPTAPDMEEWIFAQDMNDRLHHAIAALPKAERELIHDLYFKGVSERDYAKKVGISQRAANKRRRKILSKLRLLLNVIGSFGF